MRGSSRNLRMLTVHLLVNRINEIIAVRRNLRHQWHYMLRQTYCQQDNSIISGTGRHGLNNYSESWPYENFFCMMVTWLGVWISAFMHCYLFSIFPPDILSTGNCPWLNASWFMLEYLLLSRLHEVTLKRLLWNYFLGTLKCEKCTCTHFSDFSN